jgi:hypothetical protein
MWIRSQDGTILANVPGVRVLPYPKSGEPNRVVVSTVDDMGWWLGWYLNSSRAIEVIDQIEKSFDRGDKFVFHMPKE